MTIERLPSTGLEDAPEPEYKPYKVSNSEMQTFKDCRRKWWLNYYRHLMPKAKKVTGPLALGTRIHAALDSHYSEGKDLLEEYKRLLEVDRITALTEWMDTTELDSEGELGRIMLEGYLDWNDAEGIDAELDMISTEEELTMPMFDGTVELRGKIDMRVRRKADGVRMFRDFKTVGQSFTEYASTAHINEQIMTYMLLEQYQNKDGERSEGGIFTLLKKVKRSARAVPPFYEQFEVRHNVFTLRAFWNRLHGTVQDLMNVKEALDDGVTHQFVAYPRPSRDCKWKCQFFAICPMFDDGSAVEDAIRDQFEVGNPNSRYEEKKGSE